MDREEEQMPRTGVRWTEEEDQRLFEAVRAGTPLEPMTVDFGRTKGALMSRVRRWLPFGNPAAHIGDAIAALHQVLIEDPTYRPPVSIREELRAQQRTRSRPRLEEILDNSPGNTLHGNPHAQSAAFVNDLSYPAAALREAVLAVVYELRTANLIAADRGADLDPEVAQRLGKDSQEH